MFYCYPPKYLIPKDKRGPTFKDWLENRGIGSSTFIDLLPFVHNCLHLERAFEIGTVILVDQYPMERRLIINADDFGLCHSVNHATFVALQNRWVTSASVMVPCAGFADAAFIASAFPALDIGVHLTLTSEWERYKWGPIARADLVPSLVDSSGHFWPDSSALIKKASLSDVETELRCQIETALTAGIRPTHLDSHMLALWRSPRLFAAFVRISRAYSLPFLCPRAMWNACGFTEILDQPPIEELLSIRPGAPPAAWLELYVGCLARVKLGLNVLTVHLACPDHELGWITAGTRDWGSAWRQRDFEVVADLRFHRALAASSISLIGWGNGFSMT